LSGIGGVKRPGIVHRLDKDTSGLLVVAKTDAAHQGLAAVRRHGRNLSLTREYRALLWGAPERPSGTIDANLGRHATHREKIAVVVGGARARGDHHWRREETFGADKHGAPLASLIACALETGRTHQIRVHAADHGFPLIADPVYGVRPRSARIERAAAAIGRQALHAERLELDHPITGARLCLSAAAPPDFLAAEAALRA
jgi:23S rRNA pseudouridine1911/1915/1917 synthase